MEADYGTFENGKVFYYIAHASEEMMKKFTDISNEITASTGVLFEEVVINITE